MSNKPNYRRIYQDIVNMRYPDKKEMCEKFLHKINLTCTDILEINKRIFETAHSHSANQKHHSYDKSDILRILEYQKNEKLNNSQLARHFNMSRNTIAKWKKLFQV